MVADRVEFLEFVESTGDTTRRALYRVYEGDEHLFSVGVGLSRTAFRTLGLSEEELDASLPDFGRRLVEHQLAMVPGWEAANLGRKDVRLDAGIADLDVVPYRSAPS